LKGEHGAFFALAEGGKMKGLEYTLGWFETHPEEWPESYEEFLELCVQNAQHEEEEEDLFLKDFEMKENFCD